MKNLYKITVFNPGYKPAYFYMRGASNARLFREFTRELTGSVCLMEKVYEDSND